jgi:hypothetical protein
MAAGRRSCNEIQAAGRAQKRGGFVLFGFCMWMASYGANEACQPLAPGPYESPSMSDVQQPSAVNKDHPFPARLSENRLLN